MSRYPKIDAVLAGESDGCIVCGDCLEVMAEIRRETIDIIVTDPPYGINTKSDGMGKINPWADLCNSAFWYTAWIKESHRVLTDKGCLWSCLNWRSIVTFQKAACDACWPITSLAIWNKNWIGPGGTKGLRPSYEMVALWCGEDFAIPDRGIPDIQTFPWSSHKPNHPAEKPVPLMEWCIAISAESGKRGGVVFDPFCGSGTTCVAAKKLGRRWIGIDIDENNCRIALARVRDTERPLFPPEPEQPEQAQQSLFGE